ncbi:histidinol dehydrogenase [Helicobacter winghamensis]|uniref:Histidinol dehydrogenase n=1 Tax=Helicobacter winghamensis TaxID=157268 RepID=A0A2N3PJS3_9HELI|nr:histidinol dehydrogenase [Helicobacter winghamensis]PKT77265.1 histidinol dehydrogenase [Helicobacter winghamensis]PKT81431.1 histidinol dehydrogenase [Helicobacter winghamensis]PKT81608.1 histidinol dehydrogenase [Helicobacter winghamensis]QOQ97531.1 histidinol dehydrogenase [Helicobacter winghamensis]
MIAVLKSNASDFEKSFEALLARGAMDISSVEGRVKELLQEIKTQGKEAVIAQVLRFDSWNPKSFLELKIAQKEMECAYNNLDSNLKHALELAYQRIYAFHTKQMPKTWLDFEENGNLLGQKVTPVDRAGLYIPGGKAAYPSSLLMNAIPALVAGVKEIVVCTPTPKNQPNTLLLAAMHLCGIKEAYKIGGASAIGTLAYGVSGKDGIQKVDVITGPGNIYVATAKKLVFGEVNIDMIAGPSEIGILHNGKGSVDYVAWDLLSQAEHDEMASSILITTNAEFANAVTKRVDELLKDLPRKEIAEKSINERGAIIIAKDLDEAVELMNEIAPEHLEVLVENPLEILPKIKHAGAIFIGENTPEPIGDYIAGPNHTLPTGGSAKFFSPLSTEHFMKKSSIIAFSKQGIMQLGKECGILAHTEGLEAHQNAVLARLNHN